VAFVAIDDELDDAWIVGSKLNVGGGEGNGEGAGVFFLSSFLLSFLLLFLPPSSFVAEATASRIVRAMRFLMALI
jgi:hypothetical protein